MPRRWQAAGLLCLGLLLALPVIFRETSAALYAAWDGTTAYNYCFLVLPVCALLTWERRGKLLGADPKPSALGFGLLLAASAAWLLGALSGTVVVSEFTLVIMAQAIVVALLGTAAARTLLFPLAYLLFLVPMGESLIPALQSVTASFAVALLKLSGLPIHSDGLVIALPGRTWVVAEACAGLKFLVAAVAVGALLCEMFMKTWRRRALFMALSVIVPIAANGLRAYVIVMIAWFSNGKYAVGVDHLLFGWVLFAIVLAAMIGIAVAMREPPDETDPPASRIARVSQASATPTAFAAIAIGLLMTVLAVKAGASALENSPVETGVPANLPLAVRHPWAPVAAGDPSAPILMGADRTWHQAYSDGTATVFLTIGYFASERPGAEVASSRHMFDGKKPRTQTAERWQNIRAGGETFDARALAIGTKSPRRLLWHWLWIDKRYTGSPYLAKLLQLKTRLLRSPPAAAVISISTDYGQSESQDAAAGVLARFANSIGEIDAGGQK
jgi:exosortase A